MAVLTRAARRLGVEHVDVGGLDRHPGRVARPDVGHAGLADDGVGAPDGPEHQALVAEPLDRPHGQLEPPARRQGQVLGTDADHQLAPDLQPAGQPGRDGHDAAAGVDPAVAQRTSRVFIGGVPMNWATNRLAGAS